MEMKPEMCGKTLAAGLPKGLDLREPLCIPGANSTPAWAWLKKVTERLSGY